MFVNNELLWLPEIFVDGLFGFNTGWQVLADGTGASLTNTRKAYEMQVPSAINQATIASV